MLSSARRLYGLMAFFCIAGYSWLYMHVDKSWSAHVGTVCILKKTIGIPCPSCGSTRSMLSLLQGDLTGALLWNPFGFIILGGLIVVPFWLTHDLIRKQRTLMSAYRSMEILVQRKLIAWPLVIIILLNWGWNIYKGI